MKKKRKNKLIIFFILFSFLFTISIYSINQYIYPVITEYGEIELRRFMNAVSNNSLSPEIIELISDNLIVVERDHTGDIGAIDFDMAKTNTIANMIAAHVQTMLTAIENGDIEQFDLSSIHLNIETEQLKKGIIAEIPIGRVLRNPLFSKIGPGIPVKYELIGVVNTDIKNRVKDYGINHVLVELYIEVKITLRLLMPMTNQEVVSIEEIPIATRLIKGAVPYYYYTNK